MWNTKAKTPLKRKCLKKKGGNILLQKRQKGKKKYAQWKKGKGKLEKKKEEMGEADNYIHILSQHQNAGNAPRKMSTKNPTTAERGGKKSILGETGLHNRDPTKPIRESP